MIFQKSRFQVWNQSQHPFKHSLADFSFTNPSLPGVTNVESALNWIVAISYPQTKPNVATPAALPGAGNTLNDYRIVDDDGDGRSAGYRWEQREGDVAAKWYKVMDVDWSTDAILAAVTNVTDDKYFYSKGKSDLDDAGALVAGLYAGQKVYGGAIASENLTLNSNSGDGVGAQTGFVQIDSPFRPTIDDTYDLSTATERWKDAFFSNSVVLDTMTLSTGSIIDSSGAISFGDENLSTTGTFSASTITASTSVVVDTGANSVSIVPGTITDSTGLISFVSSNLVTSGTLGAGVATFTQSTQTLILDPNVGGTQATILSSLGEISFGDENLITTGTFSAGTLTGTQLNIDNIRIDGNTISSTDTDGNIFLSPDGTGVVQLLKQMETAFPLVSTSTISATGTVSGGNLQLSTNSLVSTNTNGNITLDPDGVGIIAPAASLVPTADDSFSFGSASFRYDNLFINGNIGDGTNNIATSTLLGLRNSLWRNSGQSSAVQDGDTLFWDSVSGTWLANHPDTEITHNELSGLTTTDAGHTQFVMLAGRSGGQIVQGGTAASETLDLESTSNASKGLVRTLDDFVPATDASFSGTWSGTDLGGSSNYFRDVYTKGEFRGFRLENFLDAALPSASTQNVGRVVYATDTNKAYVDTGPSFKVLGISKFVSDTAWNGILTVVNTDVSADITDARNANWQLLDNANDFEKMGVEIKVTSASNVRVTVSVPLPSGSYRLVGLE